MCVCANQILKISNLLPNFDRHYINAGRQGSFKPFFAFLQSYTSYESLAGRFWKADILDKNPELVPPGPAEANNVAEMFEIQGFLQLEGGYIHHFCFHGFSHEDKGRIWAHQFEYATMIKWNKVASGWWVMKMISVFFLQNHNLPLFLRIKIVG